MTFFPENYGRTIKRLWFAHQVCYSLLYHYDIYKPNMIAGYTDNDVFKLASISNPPLSLLLDWSRP